MNPSYLVTHCESCNNVIHIESPPPKESYTRGEINIKDGTILLSDKIVKENHKEGFCDSHSTSLAGYYCNYKCLIAAIKKILHITK